MLDFLRKLFSPKKTENVARPESSAQEMPSELAQMTAQLREPKVIVPTKPSFASLDNDDLMLDDDFDGDNGIQFDDVPLTDEQIGMVSRADDKNDVSHKPRRKKR